MRRRSGKRREIPDGEADDSSDTSSNLDNDKETITKSYNLKNKNYFDEQLEVEDNEILSLNDETETLLYAKTSKENNIHHSHHHHSSPIKAARVYKRWIIFSSLVTFIAAWAIFPIFFDFRTNLDFSKISEAFFEREIFSNIPGGNLFGDQFKTKLMTLVKPFTTAVPSSQDEENRSPGKQLKKKGASAHFPVIMIPGVTSTGLEIWEGRKCAKSLFRQRLWGTLTMLRTLLMDKECWIEHLRLDPRTGSDPDGIRLRAAQGLEAADFILPGFWVWARIISNLAEIGYDHNNLYMAAYDWRLDLNNLEKRDHYFSRLKAQIESFRRVHDRKIVIIGHSLGSNVWIYFQKWVEADSNKSVDGIGGSEGPNSKWIDHHIEAFINLAGPLLGAPKAVSTIISGETRDTAQLGTLESYLLDLLLNKQERLSLFRTWMGGFAILPKGGTRIWGSKEKGSPDVPSSADIAGYDMITVKPSSLEVNNPLTSEPYTFSFEDVDKIQNIILPSDVHKRYQDSYSSGIAEPSEIVKNDLNHQKWVNPLESRLPSAPKMKIYCMYGIGHSTERAYVYKARDPNNLFTKESVDPKKLIMPMTIDIQEENKESMLYNGIYHVDGDATVPLISLSYMCTHAWKKFNHLNPSNIQVITREYKHAPSNRVTDLRGGPGTSDHVDILGNHDLTLDILRIASNFRENSNNSSSEEFEASDPVIKDKILSNIRDINLKVDLNF